MADDPLQDGPKGAEDGDAASITERTANGEHLKDVPPPEPPLALEGAQLTLNMGAVIGNRNARRVESAAVVIQGGEREVDSLLDPDQEYDLLVRVTPDMPAPKAVRDPKTGKVRGAKLRQTVQAGRVQRADTPGAIRELFATLVQRDPKAAGALLDALREDASATLAEAA